MIFIDWLSPPGHRNFNRAFFSSLGNEGRRLYVFSESLGSNLVSTVSLNDSGKRWARAWSVLKLVVKHRREKIFFVSYDPLFVAPMRWIAHDVFVFEHNTVPETRSHAKHVVWQFLFTRGITRCAQYLGQESRLRRLRQKAVYLGSPLAPQVSPPLHRDAGGHFIVPGSRAGLDALRTLAPLLRNELVLIKGKRQSLELADIETRFVDRLEIQGNEGKIKGIIVLHDSQIRGSGWFNDAIALRLPVVIASSRTAQLFEETFPGYPYVNAAKCRDKETFERQLSEAAAFDAETYARRHNEALRERFLRITQPATQSFSSAPARENPGS